MAQLGFFIKCIPFSVNYINLVRSLLWWGIMVFGLGKIFLLITFIITIYNHFSTQPLRSLTQFQFQCNILLTQKIFKSVMSLRSYIFMYSSYGFNTYKTFSNFLLMFLLIFLGPNSGICVWEAGTAVWKWKQSFSCQVSYRLKYRRESLPKICVDKQPFVDQQVLR